jgi:hypothetical protein
MSAFQGIVRFIKTDSPEGDYFAMESTEVPGHYTGDLSGPRGWLEDHIGKLVEVIDSDEQFSIKLLKEKMHETHDKT